MRIIHPGLVQGWGVSVFHIVESLVFSAHIMKWDCHPAMRPVCSQRRTWRTCCWSSTWKERKRETKRVSFMKQRRKVRKTSWVQQLNRKCVQGKKWISWNDGVNLYNIRYNIRSGKIDTHQYVITTTIDTQQLKEYCKFKQNVHSCSTTKKHTFLPAFKNDCINNIWI